MVLGSRAASLSAVLSSKKGVSMEKKKLERKIRKGDTVMVIAGGNRETRPLAGKIGKVLGFMGDRVLIEGLNIVTRHQRAKGPDKPAGKIQKEAPLHISNVMYYAEKVKQPVRLKIRILDDGRKVRGYLNPETKEFVQIDA